MKRKALAAAVAGALVVPAGVQAVEYSFYGHVNRAISFVDDGAASEPVPDPALLDKLHVGWNSGLADYSLRGPSRTALYRHLSLPWLLRYAGEWTDPSRPRPLESKAAT